MKAGEAGGWNIYRGRFREAVGTLEERNEEEVLNGGQTVRPGCCYAGRPLIGRQSKPGHLAGADGCRWPMRCGLFSGCPWCRSACFQAARAARAVLEKRAARPKTEARPSSAKSPSEARPRQLAISRYTGTQVPIYVGTLGRYSGYLGSNVPIVPTVV